MAIGLLGTAASGLQAFQRAIGVAGHNIANANTDGYSRQRVELGTRPPSFTGQGYIGNGVQVQSVERLYDQFLTDRLRSTTSSSSQYQTFFQFASRVSNLLGDADAGLNAGLAGFFNAVQGVADDPSSIPARQLLLSEADSLVGRFRNLDAQLDSLGNESNSKLGTLVAEINSLSAGIAEANRNIVDATAQGAGQPPNDLLDKRDTMINRLSELVSVRTVEQDDGAVNVFVGTGQALVTRYLASTLQVVPNDFDARRAEIAIGTGGSSAVVTDFLTGGELGAVLDFRDQVLNPARNALGRIATTLAGEFNAQHRLGMDLDGATGNDFFTTGAPSASASRLNTGTASVAVNYDAANLDRLTTEDYVLAYNGSAWTLNRTSDNQPVTLSGTGTAADPFIADGLSLVVSGAAAAGDRFLVTPTRGAGSALGLAVTDTRGVAAAAPVSFTEAVDANGLPTNAGSGAFRFGAVDASYVPLTGGITFTYDAATQQFNYSGDASGSFAYDPATDSGSSFTVAGMTFRVSGAPADGDSFSAAANNGGVGDNGNALALADLQAALTMEGGTASFQDAYGQLIGDVGTRTRSAQITAEAQVALRAQAQESRDGLSGVNLDEEAANLLRFQQAYQALAQVISVADNTFQTLLGALGR